jgi:hypothetical protein
VEPEVVPSGFVTVMDLLPAVSRFAAGTVAINWVAETKLVNNAEPLIFTVEPDTKLVQFTVIAVVGLFAAIVLGEMLVMVAVWALTANGIRTENTIARKDIFFIIFFKDNYGKPTFYLKP